MHGTVVSSTFITLHKETVTGQPSFKVQTLREKLQLMLFFLPSSQLSEDELEDDISSPSRRAGRPSYFPDCWDDDVRMNALFTDFRSREVNPAAYDSKMKFWSDLIERCVNGEDLITFSAAELRTKLQRKCKKSHAIPKVLEELQR